VRTFDDEASRSGWCLYDMGCKGPSTFAPCPVIQWNMHTSWPIGAGHPCIGCTEKHFFDRFTPFYSVLPDVRGLGVEVTAQRVGLGLVAAAAAGVGVHAGITAVRRARSKGSDADDVPLAAFGDEDAGPVVDDPTTPVVIGNPEATPVVVGAATPPDDGAPPEPPTPAPETKVS
jgi:hydrogenase small subunit